MTKEELAAVLNGRQYGAEINKDQEAAAKAAGLVVIFGYSDDNIELRGAEHDEVGAYDGGAVHFTPAGLLLNDCDNDDCPHFKKLRASSATVEAKWDDGSGYSWTYETAIPHATFDILEDDELYCRGIVFALADVGASVPA